MAIAIIKRKSGIRYQVKVLGPDRRWLPAPSFERIEDAKIEEARLLACKRKGARAVTEDARIVSVNEFWSVWSVENRPSVSKGWKISQDQMWKTYVQPVIGEMKMIQVTPRDVGRILNRAQEAGLADQTRKHIYALVRKIFSDAVEYYEMLVTTPVRPKFHRPNVSKTKRDFLLPIQAQRLMEACHGHDYMGAPTWIMLLSAPRISEVQALRWDAVQFDLNQILIRAAFNNKTGELQDYPKQEDWAYVPMPPKLRDFLWAKRGEPGGWVAPGPSRGMLPYETYLHALRRICRQAGVPVVTPHELRHSSTEIWIQAGASAEDIRRLLNHSSLTATSAYIHRTDGRLAQLARRVGSESFHESFHTWKKEAECRPQTDMEETR